MRLRVNRRMLRRLMAALVLPIVLVGTTASGYARFRCGMGMASRTARCCVTPSVESRSQDAGGPAREQTALRRSSCCSLERVEVSRLPSTAPRHDQDARVDVAPVLPSTPIVLPAPPPPSRTIATRIPPGIGPPIHLAKQSLLL